MNEKQVIQECFFIEMQNLTEYNLNIMERSDTQYLYGKKNFWNAEKYDFNQQTVFASQNTQQLSIRFM